MKFVYGAAIGLLVLFAVVVAVVGSLATYIVVRPDLLITRIDRHITIETFGKPWRTPVSLVPTVFSYGERRKDVETTLRWSGYFRIEIITSPSKDESAANYKLHFRRNANRFPCDSYYSVSLIFDQNDELVDGKAFLGEGGCL